jgi:hypothetical protein
MLSGLSRAEVYIMHKGEKPIGFSEQNDMVLEPGAEITILKGTLADLSLSRPLEDYKFTGKKFKVDSKVVKAKEDKQLELDQKKANKAAKKQSAIDKLKVLGLTDQEVDALIGKE